MKKKPSKRKLLLIIPLAAILALAAACLLYLGSYYSADLAAIEAFVYDDAVTITKAENGNLVFAPQEATAGLVFYPGGKVEHTAYSPLMHACAEMGILCVLVEMPFHLAVFDVDAADRIPSAYPEISQWYIGGHSLGGSMAAAYLADHTEEFDGLILLGSYSTEDLSAANIDVLSVYGSEDHVLNMENYESNRRNLPAGFDEVVIDGGCHAYFGVYGPQDGDGIPAITNEEQIAVTADAIAAFTAGEDLELDEIEFYTDSDMI